MQKLRALGAPALNPRASGGRGLCPHTPFLQRLGASPLNPQSSPQMRISGYALLSVLVCYARILPTSIRTAFSNTVLTFATTYLFKSGFSALVHIKKKARNQRKVKDDIRLALSSTKLRFPKLGLWLHSLPSH